jgi:hypothetical protein
VVHPGRRDPSRLDFRLFCETYFPETFYDPWSDDQLRVIAKIERAILHGGLFAFAMSRGDGKTTLCEAACMWALLYGHRAFIVLIGADEKKHVPEMRDSIAMELETNDLLLEDFPEVCYPIRCLDRITQRGKGQMYQGKHTYIEFGEREIILPTIPGSPASGGLIRITGITGRIRGMKYKRRDGRAVRPDLVVLDDPQTDESARSLTQNVARVRVLTRAILGLAGPGKTIAGFMPCTVIARDDMADEMLNREKHPDWQGERFKMLYEPPVNEKLWADYDIVRREELKADRTLDEATKFYKARMQTCGLPLNHVRPCAQCKRFAECMDAGARISWPARFNPDEVSAVQHAMDHKLKDPYGFAAEYQNEPQDETGLQAMLTADQIAAKLNGMPRRTVPSDAAHLTAYIDVMDKALYYVVCAWGDEFTGYVVDYGTFPEQYEGYFASADIRRTLGRAFPGAGLEGRIYAGLEALSNKLLGAQWPRDGGGVIRMDRCMVDANWGQSTAVVYQFCRQSRYAALIRASHGKGLKAGDRPFAEWKKGPEVVADGYNWRWTKGDKKRPIPHMLYDTNIWKSFVHERLVVAMGDRGCLSIFGAQASEHRLFADHLVAESPVRTQGRGRELDEWTWKPHHPDNHWLDCLVGAAVAGSTVGVKMIGHDTRDPRRQKVSFAEQQRRARIKR